MIVSDLIYETSMELLEKAMYEFPEDVLKAFTNATEQETGGAKKVWSFWWAQIERLKKARMKGLGQGKPCGDSGNICFYVSIGSKVDIDPQVDWYGSLAKAVGNATKSYTIRPVSDPITHECWACGIGSPEIRYNIAHGADVVEITAVPKGGGAECYTTFKMMMPGDGVLGIRRFVIDSAYRAAKGGRSCPPNFFGVGIGGTPTKAMSNAWESASLRPYGSRHPIEWIAELEDDLFEDINSLGVGPMGRTGKITAFDVLVEYSWGHRALMPVAVVPQCVIVHRATAQIHSDGDVEYKPYPELWFGENRRTVDRYLKVKSQKP